MLFQEMQGCQSQPALLFRSDGFRRRTLAPGLDLDEDDDFAVESNQVDLAVLGSIAAMQDSQTLAAQVASRFLLASIAEKAIPERLNDWVFHRNDLAGHLASDADPRVAPR